MNHLVHSGRGPVATRRLAVGAALLLCFAGQALALDGGSRLELFYGPNETSQVTLFAVKAVLDGRPLPLEKPDPRSPPGQPFYVGPLTAGPHQLDVSLTMMGDSTVFRYVSDYRFDMQGRLEFASAEEGTVQATLTIKDRLSPGVEWTDRYALALSAVRTAQLGRPMAEPEAAAIPPSPRPATVSAAAPVAPPAAPLPAVAPVEAATCTLAPLHFELNMTALSREGRVALDRFAACLAGNRSSVRLEGHCDQRGPDDLNQRLGMDRAAAAARYLQSKGIAARRISVESRGAAAPLCVEATEACYAQNRHVEAAVGGP